ncbi:MAG: hypothetical protein HUU34_10765 [Saprospiraceae bacterium]|nr:hypothetical protein [Saprospiraceae bacterium]
MKIFLSVLETLIWHDIPQLFLAKDSVGGLYLGLAVEHTDEFPRYITVAISPARLHQLRSAQIDLYSVFAHPEMGTWLQITALEDDRAVAEPISGLDKLPDQWLPTPGEFIPPQPLLRPEAFEAVKVASIAKEAGMNPSLLRQYLSGAKRPSPEQVRRVQEALHSVARRLLEVRFV